MLVPTRPLPHPALRTGVAVGAGQAVSSHLRRLLVTAMQELLGAEHVAGVGHPVHAVQDADLGRGRAQWARSLLPSPLPALGGPSLHPCSLTTPAPPSASPPSLPTARIQESPAWAAVSIPNHQGAQSSPSSRLLARGGGGGVGREGARVTSTMNSLLE